MKTEVQFKSNAFNCTEPKDYFINDCCFGDDLCRWLIRAQRWSRGLYFRAAKNEGILPEAVEVLNVILTTSTKVRDVSWNESGKAA